LSAIVSSLILTGLTGCSSGPDPKVVVQQYFDALGKGDATTALSLMSELPDDTSLLTNQVLQAMNPMPQYTDMTMDVTTLPEDSSGNKGVFVNVTYKLNGQEVDDQSIPLGWYDTKWEITWGVAGLTVANQPTGLAINVNGVAAPADSNELWLFPGTYTIDSGNPIIGLKDGPTTITIDGPSSNPSLALGDLIITDTGLSTIQKAAHDKLQSCLDAWPGSFDPTCPADPLPDVKDGRAWKYSTGSTIDGITPTLDALSMQANWNVKPANGIVIEASGTVSGQTVTAKKTLTTVTIGLTEPDPTSLAAATTIS